jgi:uncharacterized protein (TIGR03086 family)
MCERAAMRYTVAMTDVVALFRQAQDEFTKRVARVSPDQWAGPTPDDEWTVTDLVAHIVDEHLWMPPLIAGHELAEAGKIVESVRRSSSGQPAEAWDAAALGSRSAVTEPGALDRQVQLSRGLTPVPDYVNEMIFDLTVHSWDLGVAIGMRDPLPAELVEPALRTMEAWGDMSSTGAMKPPVPVPADASAEDRLVALTGRNPQA